MTQRKQTKQLHQWYGTVEGGEERTWAEAVMSDPENAVVYTRLANCAAKSVRMFLTLAALDAQPDTLERAREAMREALKEG